MFLVHTPAMQQLLGKADIVLYDNLIPFVLTDARMYGSCQGGIQWNQFTTTMTISAWCVSDDAVCEVGVCVCSVWVWCGGAYSLYTQG